MILVGGFLSGLIATFMFDVYQYSLSYAYDIDRPRWHLVGRYFIGIRKQKYIRDDLINDHNENNELLYGYLIHYIIGIIYGYLYVILNYLFFEEVSILLAFFIGFLTVLGNWCIMMPFAFNLGFFAAKIDIQYKLMVQNLLAHFVFGVGLFIGYNLVV